MPTKCLWCNVTTFLVQEVRLTGLEPARRKTPDPKSDASTNSATGACGDSLRVQKYNVFVKYANYSAFFFRSSCVFALL